MTLAVTYQGENREFDLAEMGLDANSTPQEILQKTAWALDLEDNALDDMQVIKTEDGNVSVQPHATYA